MVSGMKMKIGGPRHQAFEAGEKKYIGSPCRTCGQTLRCVANGSCANCALAATNQLRTRKQAEYNTKRLEWYYANKERSRATTKVWLARNTDRVRETRKDWVVNNLEHHRRVCKEWREANRAKKTVIQNNRRARLLSAPGTFTLQDVQAILIAQNFHCAYCAETENLQIDHVVPISRGGSNWPWNLQWLCAAHNTSKNTKTDAEYRKIAGLPVVEAHLSLLMWRAVLVA